MTGVLARPGGEARGERAAHRRGGRRAAVEGVHEAFADERVAQAPREQDEAGGGGE